LGDSAGTSGFGDSQEIRQGKVTSIADKSSFGFILISTRIPEYPTLEEKNLVQG
jgi:hypothetical protein